MKKILYLAIVFIFGVSMLGISACAEKKQETEQNHIGKMRETSHSVSELHISGTMNYEEIVKQYSDDVGVSLEDAARIFPEEMQRETTRTFRILSVGLEVTDQYKPYVQFYCETSESGAYWGILSIHSVQLSKNYDGTMKQFQGNLYVWLRSPYQIEYIINGDFYNKGTSTLNAERPVSSNKGNVIQVFAQPSDIRASNHFKYFYDQNIVAFQQ